MLPNVADNGSLLTCELLRQELQFFAKHELRRELADLNEKMQQHLYRASLAGGPLRPENGVAGNFCTVQEGSSNVFKPRVPFAEVSFAEAPATEPPPEQPKLRAISLGEEDTSAVPPSTRMSAVPSSTRKTSNDSFMGVHRKGSVTFAAEVTELNGERFSLASRSRSRLSSIYACPNARGLHFRVSEGNEKEADGKPRESNKIVRSTRFMLRSLSSRKSDATDAGTVDRFSTGSDDTMYKSLSLNGRDKKQRAVLAVEGGKEGVFKPGKITTARQTTFQNYLKRAGSETGVHPTRSQQNHNKGVLARVCLRLEEFLTIPVAIAIGLNGVVMGMQTQYQATKVTEDLPKVYLAFELLFWIVFSFEIVVRMMAAGLVQFCNLRAEGCGWNFFDLLLVILQSLEVVSMLTSLAVFGSAQAITNLNFVRMLRILRLFRVLRMVRLLQFVSELNVIVSSISKSMRALGWTVVLLIMLMYLMGIVFTQIVLEHRIDNGTTDEEYSKELAYWWGTLARSTLTLYEAILGGADWDGPLAPLIHLISVLMGPVFILYIAFCCLAMMNVITGVFVESALKNAAQDKDRDFMQSIRDLFTIDTDDMNGDAGIVTQEAFEERTSEPALQMYLKQIGIDAKDAKLMFQVLDGEGTGVLDLEELLVGMLRLRSSAKVLDIALLMHEHEVTNNNLQDFFQQMLEKISRTGMMIRKSMKPGIKNLDMDEVDEEDELC